VARVSRTVILRDERSDADRRSLWAYLDDEGNLHIDGQDLGPSTAPASGDGEYEWFRTIRAEHLQRLVITLHGLVGDDPLDLLEARWSGARSYELERLLREGEIPTEFFSWSG